MFENIIEYRIQGVRKIRLQEVERNFCPDTLKRDAEELLSETRKLHFHAKLAGCASEMEIISRVKNRIAQHVDQSS